MKVSKILVLAALSAMSSQQGMCKKTECKPAEVETPIKSFFDEFDRLDDVAAQQFENFSQNFKRIHESLDRGCVSMAKTARLDGSNKQFFVKEFDAKGVWGVKIALPGHSKDDIKVSIKPDKDDNKIKVLKVVIHKKNEVSKEPKKQKENKDQGIVGQESHSEYAYSSTSIVGGKKRVMQYRMMYQGKDGEVDVTIHVNLPSTIDDENYTMTFKDDVLVIEFPLKDAQKQEKVLEFSSSTK